VDEVYGPMSDFAEIPPPLYEQVAHAERNGNGAGDKTSQEALSAKYQEYDDRAAAQETKGS
jgi:hypothetical protein